MCHNETFSLYLQEGFLDIAVHFTDETIIPLHQINPNDYFLEMDTINNHVVAFGPLMTADRPRVKAMGPGKGELLKLSMDLGDECRRKISDPLAVSYVYVNVDLKDLDKELDLQNDDSFKKDNRASGRWDIKPSESKKGLFDLNLGANEKNFAQDDLRNDPEQNPPDLSDMELDLGELSKSPESSAIQEARRQRIEQVGGVTPLEIGMYTLLGLVCLAVFVIISYCVVFVVRYRRKRVPKENGESIAQAKDWVWIGRATLERNRVNTQCSQTLMPPADFNGNQTVRRSGGSNRNSAGSSNRNSGVSEYKGSECNIRITSNPILNGANVEETASLTRNEVQWDYEAMGLTYDQLMEYFDNLKESTA
jgi:transmembrane protein 132